MSQVARSSSFRAMDRLAYPPAHSVAHTVEQHFRRHIQRAGIKAEVPEAAAIERIINAAFWASLRREEGRAPTISLAYVPPEAGGTALFVERPLPLDPTTLTKLAPAVERPGIHLGVWKNGDGLSVWGATRLIPPLCFVLEVIEPGLLVIKHRRADPDGKFANVAVLEGDQVKIVDAEGTLASECPDFVSTLLGFDPANVLTKSGHSDASVPSASTILTWSPSSTATFANLPSGSARRCLITSRPGSITSRTKQSGGMSRVAPQTNRSPPFLQTPR